MSTIIAGRFEEQSAADAATHALEAAGFSSNRISKFFVTPPGMHDVHGTTGDPDASAGAHHAGSGAVAGATAGGGVGVLAPGLRRRRWAGRRSPAPRSARMSVRSPACSTRLPDPSRKPTSPEQPAEEAPPRKSGVLVAVDATTPPMSSRASFACCARTVRTTSSWPKGRSSTATGATSTPYGRRCRSSARWRRWSRPPWPTSVNKSGGVSPSCSNARRTAGRSAMVSRHGPSCG